MNANAIKKVNHFGKAGKIVMTILLIAAILVTLVSGVATIYTATLPKDAVKVTVTNHAEFKTDEGSFPAIWSFLVQHVSYAADQDPSARLKDDGGKVLPPEGTELHTELDFFRQSYSSATIRSEKNEKIIDANSTPEEYVSAVCCICRCCTADAAKAFQGACWVHVAVLRRVCFQTADVWLFPASCRGVCKCGRNPCRSLSVCGKGYCGFRPVGRIDYLCCNDVPCDGVPLRRSAPEGVRRNAVRRRCDGTYCIAA